MVQTVVIGIVLALNAWFFGCIAVMWHKYHKVKEFINLNTLCKKKKLLVLVLFVLLGASIAWLFSIYGWAYTKSIRYLVLLFGVLIIAYIDLISKIIPNKILLVLLGSRSVILTVEIIIYNHSVIELLSSSFGGMIIGFVFFILAYYLSKKGIGMGDVKLISVIGFYVGTAVLYAIIIFSLIACIVYSVIQLMRKKLTTKSFIAFGPFVAIGTFIAIVLGF